MSLMTPRRGSPPKNATPIYKKSGYDALLEQGLVSVRSPVDCKLYRYISSILFLSEGFST